MVAETGLDTKTIQRVVSRNPTREPPIDAFRKQLKLSCRLVGHPKLCLVAEGARRTPTLIVNSKYRGANAAAKTGLTYATTETGPHFVLGRHIVIAIQKNTIGLN